MIVGLMASWGVSILFRWDGLAFYLIHILCWFLSDWMLLTIVQVSEKLRLAIGNSLLTVTSSAEWIGVVQQIRFCGRLALSGDQWAVPVLLCPMESGDSLAHASV